MKKLIFMLLTAALCMTGCNSTGLVHDKCYLRAVYIDGETEKRLTFVFFSDDRPVSAEGPDISSAVKEAEIKAGKPIVTGFTELILLGNCDTSKILDYMLNTWKVSPSCRVIENQENDELLRKHDAEFLCGAVKEAEKQGKIPPSQIVPTLHRALLLQQLNTAKRRT